MRRRELLAGAVGLGVLAAARPLAGWVALLEGRRALDGARLAALLAHLGSARAVGAAYLSAVPAEARQDVLTALVLRRLRAGQRVSDDRLRALLLAAVREDFAAGDVVELDGWVVAATEARLCALATLT